MSIHCTYVPLQKQLSTFGICSLYCPKQTLQKCLNKIQRKYSNLFFGKVFIQFNDFLSNMDFDFENQIQTNQNQNQDGYYQEYCRLFLANIALTNQVKQLSQQKGHLKYRLSKYEDEECYSSFQRNQKSKRFRRNAHEIQRFYKCTEKSCGKSYGSEGSLNQHYKLKHPDIYARLANVQPNGLKSEIGQQQDSHQRSENKCFNSSSKVHSILKQFGEINSFKSIKIQELKFDLEDKQNKENKCHNIRANVEMKQFGSSKKQFISLVKKQESILTQDGSVKLKRSSRTIKKREF